MKVYGTTLICCTVGFFPDDNIYVNFLHSHNKYVDSRTLGCLSVLWWIQLYAEETAWKTDLVLATCEELLTCQRNILLQGRGEAAFPSQGGFTMEYWYILKNKKLRERISYIYDSCHNIPLFSDLVEIGQ